MNRECINGRWDGIGVGIYAPNTITLTEGRLAIGHHNHLIGGPPSSLQRQKKIWTYGNHAQDLYIKDAAPYRTTCKN